jgi:hypothetical protein
MQQRTLAAAALVVVWHAAAGPPAQHAPPGSTFRVFLRTGEPLPSYGEAAIVGDRVVFTLLVGGESDLRRRFQLVDLAADDVDLDRTVAYATAVRGAHYAATRGEAEYAAMTAEVSRALDALPELADPVDRVQAAERARERMRGWSRQSYGHRAGDVEALEYLFDVVIGELRADAGASQIALELSSREAPRAVEPLRPAPDTAESVRLALAAAAAVEPGPDRYAILHAAGEVAADAGGLAGLGREVRSRLAAEREADERYAALARELTWQANAAIDRGDPDEVTALISQLAERDAVYGRMRPRVVRDLGRQMDLKRTAAAAYRSARARYAAVRPALLAYERRIRAALSTMDGLRPVLDAVREMRFTSFDGLRSAAGRIERTQDVLAAVSPPEDLADVHATLTSAVHLAREALARRQTAAATAAGSFTRDASSAAAGSLLLLGQARGDLVARLFPPKPR